MSQPSGQKGCEARDDLNGRKQDWLTRRQGVLAELLDANLELDWELERSRRYSQAALGNNRATGSGQKILQLQGTEATHRLADANISYFN